MSLGWNPSLPGMTSARTASHRNIFLRAGSDYLPGGRIIDGSESRDPGNTGNLGVLRAGLLMGQITSTGLYAPTIVGVLASAYTSGGVSLTVTAAQAVELDRLVGQSGTAELVAIGPPSAAGTVATTDITHSAINTSTGVITVSSLGVNKIAGTFICVKDGRQTPITFIPDNDYGVPVTDQDGNSVDVSFPRMPITGVIDSSQIINWPSDTSLRSWIVASLNGAAGGQYVFDHIY